MIMIFQWSKRGTLKCLMTCLLICIISGVLLDERSSCANKCMDVMSTIFFLISMSVTNGISHSTYSFFESVNAEPNNEVKATITICNI